MRKQHCGSLLLGLGFLLCFGAVGGMDNPEQAGYLVYQITAAVVGAVLAWWGTELINQL